MKSFFKYLLATMVGIILTSLILFFIGVGIVSALSSKAEKPVNVKSGSVLVLKLNKQIVDRQPEIPLDLPFFESSVPLGLNVIVRNIEKAATDDNIKGIYIEFSSFAAGNATLEEIRNALVKFKISGKFIYSYSEYYSQNSYYLASVSDKVFLNPAGMFFWTGVNSQRFYYKNTLEKLGLKPQVLKIGKYKSYGEMFTNNEMSEANREQTQQYLNSFWKEWTTKIEASRGISVDKLDQLANELSLRSTKDVLNYGFVDSLIYKDQLIAILKSKLDVSDAKKIPQVVLSSYDKVPVKRDYKGLAKDKIALIYASGSIVMGDGDEDNIGSEKYSRIIRKVRNDSMYKAIVLRVNSPGGSALASDVIWREVKLASEAKPVVVSMGDVAASGGYYISCAADTILVNKQTITGSIGVIMTYMNAEGLLDKVGVSFDNEKTHQHADFLNGLKDLTKAEYAFLDGYMHETYDTFVNHVAEGRSQTYDAIHNVAQGRVWAGKAAIENNLADAVHDLSDAVAIAAKLANIEDKYRVVDLPKQEDPIEKLLKDVKDGDTKVKNVLEVFGVDYTKFKIAKDIFTNKGVQYAMPYQEVIR